ncbi:CPSF30, partial [Symbiodinium pilosum]
EEIHAKDASREESLRAEGLTSAEGALNRGSRTVCRHWLKGLCMKGDKCDYLHQFDLNRMPECLFFLKTGKCYDQDCLFKHVAASERQECPRYRMGFCRLGPLCRMSHERLPRDKMPDVLPDWFIQPLLKNGHLVPKAEDVKLSSFEFRRTESFALTASTSTELGAIPGLPPPVQGKCRFFVMRSMNLRNLQISACKAGRENLP